MNRDEYGVLAKVLVLAVFAVILVHVVDGGQLLWHVAHGHARPEQGDGWA